MTFRLPIRSLLLVLLTGVLLAGCSSDDDEGDDTPTAVPPTQAAASPTGEPTTAATSESGGSGATTVPATFAAGSGQKVTDGICQATIPDEWVDDGTGKGATASGARYLLFGNTVPSDDEWNQGVKLVKDAAAKVEGSNVTEGDNFVRVDKPDGKGFEYRGRFDNRYCDFSAPASPQPPPPYSHP